MEFLILPVKKEDDVAVPLQGPAIEAVMTALIAALKCWFLQGKCGGLRQLTVPTRSEEDIFRCSTQYIEAVIQFCPNIEYLDEYSKVLFHGYPYCDERWFINLETWEVFNSSCSALRKFNWLVLPFADPYFRVFGNYLKPQLHSLSLSANLDWNYMYFFHYYTGSENLRQERHSDNRPGYGLGASDPSAALKGCLNLRNLTIGINFNVNDKRREPYVNTEVYGDGFWATAATYCPLLETISMFNSSDQAKFIIRPIEDLTDTSLLSLIDFKRLARYELGPARFTGSGIFEYLQWISGMEDWLGWSGCLALPSVVIVGARWHNSTW